VLDLVGPAPHQRLQRRLGGGVGAPERLRPGGAAGGEEQRPAGLGAPQQRLGRADQAVDGAQVGGDDLVPELGINVGDRPEPTQHRGGVNQDVEMAVAVEELGAENVDRLALGQIERHERWAVKAQRAKLVVELLQGALSAANGDHVGAGCGERDGAGAADAAGGAGDEGDLAREGLLCGVSHLHGGLLT